LTIHVQTPDHGVQKFDANDWRIDEADHLWVGDWESGTGVAEFAEGAWLFVWETNDEAPAEAQEPRVFQTLLDIPLGVTEVLDRDGDSLYLNEAGETRYHNRKGTFWPKDEQDEFGPYTEVLDAK
jgi:hypothetical protein